MNVRHAASKKLTPCAVVAIAVAATFCAPAGPGPAVERIDEGGVEVVTSSRPAWAEGDGWQLSAEPDLVIGENTDELSYIFSFVSGAVALPDGRIAAGDYGSRELRFFDPEGRFLRAAGGEGQGPGELGVIADVMRCGAETLFVLDGMRYEVNVVSLDGEFGPRHPFEVNAGVSLLFPLLCNDAGQLLGLDFGGQLTGNRPTGFHRTRAHAWLLDSQGFVLQDFGEFAGVELFEFNGRTSRHPFGKRVALALGNEGAYIGTADDFEIEAAIRPSDRVEEFRLRTNAMPLPDTFPAHESFVLDVDENLWVQHFPRPGEARNRWSVFDPTGVWLGELSLPASLRVTDIGADYVLGVYRDEFGQESVRRYALWR